MKLAKLPNASIVPVDEHGFIAVDLMVDLSTIINSDLEGLLDHLSDLATGTGVLSNISYKPIEVVDGAIKLKVCGNLELIEHEVIEAGAMPMQAFEVTVSRISYGSRTFVLSARTEDEAREIGADDAGNHLYDEHCAEYEVTAIVRS